MGVLSLCLYCITLANVIQLLAKTLQALANTLQSLIANGLQMKKEVVMRLSRMKVTRILVADAPGLGARIRKARIEDGRSVEAICAEAQVSRVYWYDIESEKLRSSLPEETLRKIERTLKVDFGVDFETPSSSLIAG